MLQHRGKIRRGTYRPRVCYYPVVLEMYGVLVTLRAMIALVITHALWASGYEGFMLISLALDAIYVLLIYTRYIRFPFERKWENYKISKAKGQKREELLRNQKMKDRWFL